MKHAITLLGFILICLSLMGAEKIKNIQSYHGLSSNIIFDIQQDDQGFIWIATEEGVSKYNGQEFVNYQCMEGDTTSLSHNQVLALCCDGTQVYAATHRGVSVYDMKQDRFRQYLHDPNRPFTLPVNQTRCIIKRKRGGFWVGTYGGGVAIFDEKKQSFHALPCNYRDNRIMSLYEDENDNLYIGTHFNGVTIYNQKTNRVIHFDTQNSVLRGNQVECMVEDCFGYVWIGTWNGLLRYDPKTTTLQAIQHPVLSQAVINKMVFDALGQLWIGTEYYLCRFKPRDGELQKEFDLTFYHESPSVYGLTYKTVRSLFADKDDNIWIGTYSGGLNFISRYKQKFNLISHEPEFKNTLSYQRVSSICEDSQSNLWIATDGGGVNCYSPENGNISILKQGKDGLSDNAVLCSLYDSDGTFWFGTYQGGLNCKPKNASRMLVYKHTKQNAQSLPEGDVICLHEDAHKQLWVGLRSGLCRMNKADNSFTVIPELKWEHVSCMAETKEHLLIGTFNAGIFVYNFATGKVERQKVLKDKGWEYYITSIYLQSEEVQWVATYGHGLHRIDLATGEIRSFNEKNGLANNYISSIIADNEGDLWLSTNKGISHLSLAMESIDNYDSKDGVQAGQFLNGAGLRTKKGWIAFGGTEGLNLFNPALVKKDTLIPNVVLTDFLLFNKQVGIRSESNPNSPLSQQIAFEKEITLEYHESVFTLEYAAVNFISPERIEYAYLLEGAESNWNYVKNRRSATYRNLSPGTYVFKVKASSTDGYFNEDVYTALKIIVRPPFWNTWWAYIVYAILIAMLAYLIWNMATIRLRAAHRIRLERIERQKSEELYLEKLQFFTNVSHELRTPLTLIKAPLERLLRNEESPEKSKLLSLINRNTQRLLHHVNEIMDLRKIDRGQMHLRVQQFDLLDFVHDVLGLFQEAVAAKNILLRLQTSQKELKGWADPDFLDKVLFNLLSNALKFTPEGGVIEVNVSLTEGSLLVGRKISICVTDTGAGISATDLNRIFERFYQVDASHFNGGSKGTGIGLHLVKSLVEIHKGTIRAESCVGRGSSFSITIPFDREAYIESEIDKNRPVAMIKQETYLPDVLPEVGSVVAGQSPQPAAYRILLVEDDAEIRQFLKLELGSEYQLSEAEDGEMGLAMALKIIPDLIVSDVMMPKMDGVELCKELKTNINTNHIPVILLTAKASSDHRIEGLEVGADSYIPKPFDMRHLRVRIKKLIELREQLKEKYVKHLSLSASDGKQENQSQDVNEQFMRQVVDYILAHLAAPDLKGESIAEAVAMSRMSLHRKLKAITGLSAGEIIRDVRLEQGCKLLKEGRLSVSEISYDVGFSSPSYFYTCFLKKYGVAPSDFAK